MAKTPEDNNVDVQVATQDLNSDPKAALKWLEKRHLEDLERELRGAQDRGDDDHAKAVREQLKALGGTSQKTATKRPKAEAKETR